MRVQEDEEAQEARAVHEALQPELLTMLVAKDARVALAGRTAVEEVLEAMEAANKVMYREGRVHLI